MRTGPRRALSKISSATNDASAFQGGHTLQGGHDEEVTNDFSPPAAHRSGWYRRSIRSEQAGNVRAGARGMARWLVLEEAHAVVAGRRPRRLRPHANGLGRTLAP